MQITQRTFKKRDRNIDQNAEGSNVRAAFGYNQRIKWIRTPSLPRGKKTGGTGLKEADYDQVVVDGCNAMAEKLINQRLQPS